MRNKQEIQELIGTLETLKKECCATDISLKIYIDALQWVINESQEEGVAP